MFSHLFRSSLPNRLSRSFSFISPVLAYISSSLFSVLTGLFKQTSAGKIRVVRESGKEKGRQGLRKWYRREVRTEIRRSCFFFNPAVAGAFEFVDSCLSECSPPPPYLLLFYIVIVVSFGTIVSRGRLASLKSPGLWRQTKFANSSSTFFACLIF